VWAGAGLAGLVTFLLGKATMHSSATTADHMGLLGVSGMMAGVFGYFLSEFTPAGHHKQAEEYFTRVTYGRYAYLLQSYEADQECMERIQRYFFDSGCWLCEAHEICSVLITDLQSAVYHASIARKHAKKLSSRGRIRMIEIENKAHENIELLHKTIKLIREHKDYQEQVKIWNKRRLAIVAQPVYYSRPLYTADYYVRPSYYTYDPCCNYATCNYTTVYSPRPVSYYRPRTVVTPVSLDYSFDITLRG